jgi:hypothetical protein
MVARIFYFTFFASSIIACGEKPAAVAIVAPTKADYIIVDEPVHPDLDSIGTGEVLNEFSDYLDLYVLVADTGTSYYNLRSIMISSAEKLEQEVDTMGREFNSEKNLIALPIDAEDEMWAGDYYPRRFASNFLSLEYLDYYEVNAGDSTIVIVSGIYDMEASADSALAKLKTVLPSARLIKTKLYQGCMH